MAAVLAPIAAAAPVRRVLVLAESVAATQFISFGQALQGAVAAGAVDLAMAGDDPAWDVPAARVAWLARHDPTVLVLSRYSNARALALRELARERGLPVVFHIDDDLLDVPMALGKSKYDFYHQPARIASLRAALDGADLVYASTGALAERLRGHGITAPIVAGDVYCSVDVDRLPVPLPATGPVVGYMGTGGHSRDLAMVMPALVALMDAIPELRFETFGTIKPPPEMAPFGTRYAHHAGVADYEAFVERLSGLGWWVGLAPLEDNAFNRCKADTKWVEYSFAGIATVATDLPVYHRACADGAGRLASTPEDWRHALGALLRDGRLRQAQVARARQRLRERYARRALQEQVLGILGSAVARPRQ